MPGLLIRTAAITAALVLLGAAAVASETYTRITDNGHYRVSLRSVPDVPPIARLHNWIVHVETRDGETFMPTRLGINGGMPGHKHGLVSAPLVTEYLDNGDFLIEGMKFHMGGDWQLVVGLAGPNGIDQAVFELSLSARPANVDHTTTTWSDDEIAFLEQMTLDRLDPAADPTNRFSGSQRAAELGQLLFFDKALSASGTVACATCHDPEKKFADGKKKSFGTKQTARHTPSLIGVAHGNWFYWDGRRDSLWAQTVTPIETPGEMDNTRVNAVAYMMNKYAALYEEIVGDRMEIDEARYPENAGPHASGNGKQAWRRMQASDREAINRAFSNIGKFLAAFVATLEPRHSRFDDFVAALAEKDTRLASKLLSEQEQAGLKLFLDGSRTQCLRCHNGPMFTNFGFHNIATGIGDDGTLDYGRMYGLQSAKMNEFNCRGLYSDASTDACTELRFFDSVHTSPGAFKVPTLRNVAQTAPYMHDGRFATLEEAVKFYTEVPDASAGRHELPALDLSEEEIEQLVAFLETLSDGSK